MECGRFPIIATALKLPDDKVFMMTIKNRKASKYHEGCRKGKKASTIKKREFKSPFAERIFVSVFERLLAGRPDEKKKKSADFLSRSKNASEKHLVLLGCFGITHDFFSCLSTNRTQLFGENKDKDRGSCKLRLHRVEKKVASITS